VTIKPLLIFIAKAALRRADARLNAIRVGRSLAHPAVALRDQPIDLAQERFAVYVPAHSPAEGYGLLVFVPPWENAMLPRGWAAILDRHGVIAARHSTAMTLMMARTISGKRWKSRALSRK
jgi:hypothetical protein